MEKLVIGKTFVIKDKKFEKYIKNYLNDKTDVISIKEIIKRARRKFPKK